MSAAGKFDTKRLARIDSFIKERYLDSGLLPHAQVLVARDGEVAHFSSQGPAREGGAAIDEASLFRIASMTKLSPSSTYPVRRELKTMIYAALT